ncbi:hypothetical protein J5N97_005376 [Dioscorea zingiberensis]|uniref:Ubiquitin-activating enzyme SCCH domain-containing protein n=1 Tax=Dioscorea zingiberensis TaxID=325984 RepID=A0A9D5D7Y3_9LILI|nr:hypothetical protein J5N97_005376 [Dioscorea zingiberensis]
MGVCCSSEGKLTITYDDIIENSDLSHQFLFHYWNVGQAKSTVASASAAECINPRLHIEANPETEDVFNDAFWDSLDVVISALGNVKARNYINSRFEDYFVNCVKQLTLRFPKDSSSTGHLPFWQPPKHFPKPLQFSSRDPAHLSFIMSASVLIVETFQIPIPDSFMNPSVLGDAVDNCRMVDLKGYVSVNDIMKKLEKFTEKLPPGFRMKLIEFG